MARDKLELLGDLLEAFGRQVGENALKMMVKALDDIPIQDLEDAANSLLKTNRFMPSVAELREAAGFGDEDESFIRIGRMVADWLERNKGWDRFKATCPPSIEEVDEALVGLHLPPGTIGPEHVF